MAARAQEIRGRPEAATLPEWIRLLPVGKVELVDRRQSFEVDQESLAAMVADFESRGVDLVIDYEHQSLHGERAPAAGWIKRLEARADGLWAQVEWTPQAQEYLKRREYRYFSPVLRLNLETRKPAVLMQVGLTNVPAIKNLPPLVAKWGGAARAEDADRGEREDQEKMMEKVKCLVGLEPGTAEEVVWGKVLEGLVDLAAALNLPENASVSQMKGAVAALKAAETQLKEIQEELQALKYRLAEETAAQVVGEALKAGKISPAQKGWADAYFRQDPEGFRTYVAKAPQLIPMGEAFELLKADRREGEPLLPEELALCRSLNLAPAEYLKAKAQIGSA